MAAGSKICDIVELCANVMSNWRRHSRYNLDLWPLRSPRMSVTRVIVSIHVRSLKLAGFPLPKIWLIKKKENPSVTARVMRLADHDQTLTFRAWSWRGIHGTDYLPASFRASATFRCRVITLTFDLLDHRASARVGDESSYSIRFPSLTFVGRPSRFEDRPISDFRSRC